MKKHWRVSLLAFLIILGVFLFVPRNKDIDVQVTAMEYSYSDPAYAVPHTVIIQGSYTTRLLGEDEYRGTLAVSGVDGSQPPTKASVLFFDAQSLAASVSYLGNSSTDMRLHLLNCEVNMVFAEPRFTRFAIPLYDIDESADHPGASWVQESGRFLAFPAQSRAEAISLLEELQQPRE